MFPQATRASRRIRGLDPLPQELEIIPGLIVEALPAQIASKNSTFHRFGALPAEIRKMVYRELLVSNQPIDIDWVKPRLQPNILQTCKQVFQEAHPILYEENTWKIRIGKTEELLLLTIPILPPGPPRPLCPKLRIFSVEECMEMRKYDENPVMRTFDKSYIHDIMPDFMQGTLAKGLWVNSSFCVDGCPGCTWPRHFFREKKLPRHLIVAFECSDLKYDEVIRRYNIEVLAKTLEHIPHIRSLAITCENAPKDMWDTKEGAELGGQLQAWLGGTVRGVRSMSTVGIPKSLSTALISQMMSHGPKSRLLLMYKAFEQYMRNLWFVSGCSWDALHGDGAPLAQARRAMERGDWDGFLRHREVGVKELKDAGERLGL